MGVGCFYRPSNEGAVARGVDGRMESNGVLMVFSHNVADGPGENTEVCNIGLKFLVQLWFF